MGVNNRIMVPGIGHYSVCIDGFDTLDLGLNQELLLINGLAIWSFAEGRKAWAEDTAFTFFQNAQKTSVVR